MAKLTEGERATLRARIGTAYLQVQNEYREGHEAIEIIPEMIAAALSLACFVGHQSGIDRQGMTKAVMKAVRDEYDKPA